MLKYSKPQKLTLMKKLFFFSALFVLMCNVLNAQLKMISTGEIAVGSTTATPVHLLDLIGGDINTQSAKGYRIGNDYILRHNNHPEDLFVGIGAGNATMTQHYQTCVGNLAGTAITSGKFNSLVGYAAGISNTSGQYNTVLGHAAMAYNTSSSSNTMIGYTAGYLTTGPLNTYVGSLAGYYNTTGYQNTFVGASTGASANNYQNCTAIGYGATVSGTNKIILGNTSVTHIQGYVDFTTASDGRFKTNIQENVKGLAFINKLRPITYQMNTQQLDEFLIQDLHDSVKTLHQLTMDFAPSTAMIRSGFIAQEVDSVANLCGFQSSIVHTPENNTDPYGISYSELVVPLVKAVQELSQMVDSLKIVAKTQQNHLDQLQADLTICCNKPINDTKMGENNTGGIETNEHVISIELAKAEQIILYQNEPNPFNGTTVIRYYIPENMQHDAFMAFYDAYGKEIKNVKIGESGFGKIEVNAQNVAAGIYTYSLLVNGRVVDTKKMIKNK